MIAKLNAWMEGHRTLAVVAFACGGLAIGLLAKVRPPLRPQPAMPHHHHRRGITTMGITTSRH